MTYEPIRQRRNILFLNAFKPLAINIHYKKWKFKVL